MEKNEETEKPDYIKFIKLLFEPEDVFGVTILYDKFNTYGGYFNLNSNEKTKKIEKYIKQHDGQATGVYVTINPLNGEILAEANNEIGKGKGKPSDKAVLYYKHLLIDADPERLGGICSTNEQHEFSIKYVKSIKEYLTSLGWPEPLTRGDSGNGSNLIYKLPNLTIENNELIKKCLISLNEKLAIENKIHIDVKVFDPSRITRLLGTINKKGQEVPELTIFHRRSRILESNENTPPVLLKQLIDISKEKTSKTKKKENKKSDKINTLNVKSYLKHYKIDLTKEKELKDGTILYCLRECIFDSSHKGNESGIGQQKDGGLFYQCFHDSCSDKKWEDARKIISGEDKLTKFYPEGTFDKYNENELYEFTKEHGLRRWTEGNKKIDPHYFKISNFLALIKKEIIKFDGINTDKWLEIEIDGYKNEIHHNDILLIQANKFENLKWVSDNYPSWAIIEPEMTKYVRHAIQCCSDRVEKEINYTHTGWVKNKNGWCYLSHAGAIGQDDIKIDLKGSVPDVYSIPISNEKEYEALKASYDFLTIGNEKIVYPLWIYIYLSTLTTIINPIPNFILYLYGKTGTFKTELAHLALSHFGPYSKFKRGTSDCTFEDTANSIEKCGFHLKDTLMLLDDYCPTRNKDISEKMNKTILRMIRLYSNRSAKKRLNADSSAKMSYEPRGMLIITGEDSVEIESAVARIFEIDLSKDDINIDKLSELQKKAKLFPYAINSFINWLIPRLNTAREEFEEKFNKTRNELLNNSNNEIHKRQVEQASFFIVMSELLMNFMNEKKITNHSDSKFITNIIKEIFIIDKTNKIQTLKEMSEIDMFFNAVNTLIEQGKIYLFNKNNGTCTSKYVDKGKILELKPVYKYRGKDKDYFDFKENGVDYEFIKKNIIEDDIINWYIEIPDTADPRLKGDFVGWYDNDNYYFLPRAILTSIYDYYKKTGSIFPVSERTLKKRLKDSGKLITDKSDEKHLSSIISINNKSKRVLSTKKMVNW